MSFRVPHHQPDHIASWPYVEARFERNAGLELVFQSVILQIHGYNFLHSLNKVSIAIKQSGDTGQYVIISALDFSKVQVLHVHMSEDDKLGILVTGFEKLGMQFDGKIMKLLVGVHCVFDFLLGLLVRVGEVFRRVIAAASLQGQFLLVLQRDLQIVKTAIELEVLGNEPST